VRGFLPHKTGALVTDCFCNGHLAAVLKLPRAFAGSWVIFYMLYLAAPFKYKCFKAFVAQLFGSPATAATGTNNNGIVGSFFRGISIISGHSLMLLYLHTRNNGRALFDNLDTPASLFVRY